MNCNCPSCADRQGFLDVFSLCELLDLNNKQIVFWLSKSGKHKNILRHLQVVLWSLKRSWIDPTREGGSEYYDLLLKAIKEQLCEL